MEVLLTPVVTKLLKRFIKSAEGRSSSSLRVSLSGGSVLLHNLELNLEPVLQDLPVTIERAFARQLRLVIPWTSLATQPIQVLLDTVEVVLSLSDKQISSQDRKPGFAEKPSGGWMGSFTSMFMHALFNVSITVSNVVIKYTAPNTVTTMTFGAIKCFTATDTWRMGLSHANDWLKKQLDIENVAISIQPQQAPPSALADNVPVLRSKHLHFAALAPVFAVLANRAVVGQTTADIDVTLAPIVCTITNDQLAWLKVFAQSLPTVLAARGSSQQKPMQQLSDSHPTAPTRRSSVLGSTVSAVGQAWMYITDEAAAVAAEGPDGLDKTSQHHAPMPKPHLHFNVTSEGGSVLCCKSGLSLTSDLPYGKHSANSMSRSPAQTALPLTHSSGKHATMPVSPHRNPYMQELEEAASGLTPRHAEHSPILATPSGHTLLHPSAQQAAPAPSSADATAATSSLPSAFATLQWQALHTEASLKAGKINFVKVWLQEASVQRPVPTSNLQAGIQQEPAAAAACEMQDVFRLQAAHGIEHSALQDAQGQPLACHVHWKPQHGVVVEHQVSVHLGTVTAVHVPGFITTFATFAGLASPNSSAASTPQPSSPKEPKDQARHDEPPGANAVRRASVSLSLSVLGIGFGAMSSAGSDAHAAWVACSKLSLHLGQIRARGRPGSLAAGLLSLQKGPSPEHGLRVSAVGVQLGVVPRWQGTTNASTLWPAGVQELSEPIEMQALVQGWPLLQGPARPQLDQASQVNQLRQSASAGLPQTAWPTAPSWHSGQPSKPEQPSLYSQHSQASSAPDSSPAAPAQLVTAASSAVHLNLTGLQLAMLASVAEAITSETSRRFNQALPPQAISPSSQQDAGKAAWLNLISLQTAPTYLMLTMNRTLDSVLAIVPSGLKTAVEEDADATSVSSDAERLGQGVVPAAVVMCDKLSLTMAVGPADTVMPAVCIALAMPHVWACPGVKACLPACEVHMALLTLQASKQADTPPQPLMSADPTPDAHATACGVVSSQLASQPPQVVSVQTLGSPVAVISSVDIAAATPHAAKPVLQAGSTLNIGVQSVSLDVDAVHITMLVRFAQCTMLGPPIPVLPTYPQHEPPVSTRMEVEMQAQMLFGQVQMGSIAELHGNCRAPDLSFWLTSPGFSFSKSTAQGPDAQCNDQAFYQPPITTKTVALCLPSFNLATAAASAGEEEGEAVSAPTEQLQWVCRLTPSRAAAKAQAEPAELQDGLLSLQYSKVERPTEDDSMDLVLMTQALHMQMSPPFVQAAVLLAAHCARALKAQRISDTDAASEMTITGKATVLGLQLGLVSGTGQHAQFEVDDVILIVHNAMASDWQRLGLPGLQIMTMDLALAAARLTVYSEGLPPHGLLMVMPADLHLSVVSSRPPNSYTVALSADVLPLNLSPAAVSSLLTITNAMKAAARLPQGKSSAQPRAQPLAQPLAEARQHDSIKLASASAEEQLVEQGTAAEQLADDLRCGMFSMAPVRASRPGPLQVSVGEEHPGYMPWSGSGESWVGWCYPYPRPVQVLCVQGGVALLGQAQLELCHYLAEVDDYIPLACSFHPDAITGDLHIFVTETVVALEWQLWCSSPSKEGHCTAKALLSHLLVNLPSLTTDLPPLQLVPFTCTLQVKHIRLSLLVETTTADASQAAGTTNLVGQAQALGMVYITALQAVCHKWPESLAAALYTRLAINYMDDLTLTEEILLEPSNLALQLEQGPESSTTPVSPVIQPHSSSLPLSLSEKQLSLPRPQPSAPGFTVHLRSGDGPLQVRIGQLALDSLRRALHLGSESIQAHLLRQAPPPLPVSSSPQQAPLSQPASEQSQQLQAQPRRGILIKNMCLVDLLLGQVGTAESVDLQAESDMPYIWQTPPGLTATAQRLLHIAYKPQSIGGTENRSPDSPPAAFRMMTSPPSSAAPSSPQSPLPEAQDRVSSSQLQATATAAANMEHASHLTPSKASPTMGQTSSIFSPRFETHHVKAGADLTQQAMNNSEACRQPHTGSAEQELAWSASFDCTARSCCQLKLQLSNGRHCCVAVSVQKAGLQWQVLLQPSHVLLNKTAGIVHVHYIGQLPQSTQPMASGEPLTHDCSFTLAPESKEGEAGHAAVPLLPVVGTTQRTSCLQVWLGSTQGWSLPVSLTTASPQVVLLRPSGLGKGSPTRPLGSAVGINPGMWCQLTAPDAVLGQASIVIWPLYSLYNALPGPLHWRLTKASSMESTSHGALFAQPQWMHEGDQDIVQPGQEVPLAAGVNASQRLSLQLADEEAFSDHASGAAASEEWSIPLLIQHAGRLKPGIKLPVADDQSHVLPDAGAWQVIDIPCGQISSLSCLLVAQPGLDQVPMISLSLVPHAVLHNSLPFPVCLSFPSTEMEVPVAAGSSQALDWSSLKYRPKKVALAVREKHGSRLQSQAFALDTNHDTQLNFSGAVHSTQGTGSTGSQVLTFYAAVKVQNEPFEMRAASEGSDEAHIMEVTHISITPACFVTNLTHHQLSLRLQGQPPEVVGQQPQWHEQPLGQTQIQQLAEQQQQQHRQSWQLSCGPSQTVPVLNAWQQPVPMTPQRPHVHPNPAAAALAVAVHLTPPTAPSTEGNQKHMSTWLQSQTAVLHSESMAVLKAVQLPVLGTGQSHGKHLPHEPAIALMQPCGRRHLLLTDSQQDQPVLLAYRSTLSQGRLHLVFFTDPQPPCVFHNAAGEEVALVWSALHRDKHGVLQEQDSREVVKVPAGASLDCSPRSLLAQGHQGVGGEQEDEEAFLEGITNPAGPSLPQLAVKIKLPSSNTWSHALLIKPGQHQAGEVVLKVEARCANQHITLSLQYKPPHAGAPRPEAGTPPAMQECIHQQQQQQQPKAAVHVAIECLVISVWDDEKGRLLGHAGKLGRPAELCCIFWDHLHVSLDRALPTGGNRDASCTKFSMELTAAGLQCDSFCQDSSHPVMLCSLPASDAHRVDVKHSSTAAFAISLQVCEASLTQRDRAARSFCNTWVEQFVLQLPTLAVAIDDSLMALVERCMQHLVSPALPVQGAMQPTGLRRGPGMMGRAHPGSPGPSWTPSARSPMTLLEQARQARQLNDVLDNFGANTQTGTATPSPRRSTLSPSQPGGTSLVNMAAASATAMSSHATDRTSAANPAATRPFTPPPDPQQTPLSSPGPSGRSSLSWVDSQLSAELLAQSLTAAAPRLLLRNFSIAKIKLLFDIHVANGGPNLPFALDTQRAPLTVAGVGSNRLLFRPSVMLHGLLAHALAEALLSAPGMLGSLDLLFNPTGLLQSLSQAWGDLLLGPLAAIEARSPSQFIVGLGAGGASFVKQLSAWTLGSIGSFSNASSKVLARALQSQPAVREGAERRGLVGQGLRGLVGGVTAGVTGVVRVPLQSYNDGSGLIAGMGRGLLGVVGLPLSGALGLVGAVSSGLASTAGLTPPYAVRRPGRLADGRPTLSASGVQRLTNHLSKCGAYIAHCQPQSVEVHVGNPDRPGSEQQQLQTVQEPVLVLTTTHLLVLQQGLQPVVLIQLPDVRQHVHSQHQMWRVEYCQEGMADEVSITCHLIIRLHPFDSAVWTLLVR